jgi:hypothetical protein
VLLYLDKAIVSDSAFVLDVRAFSGPFPDLLFASTAHQVLTRYYRSPCSETGSNVLLCSE